MERFLDKRVSFLCNIYAFLLFICQSDCNVLHQDSYSVTGGHLDYVHFSQPPIRLQDNFPLHVEYVCTEESYVRVDVRVWTESQEGWVIFRSQLKCRSEDVHVVQHRIIHLKLPRYVAYRPSRQNRYCVFVEKKATIEIWMTRLLSFLPKRWIPSMFGVVVKEVIEVAIDLPFDRPERPLKWCPLWSETIQGMLPYVPQCPVEKEVVQLVNYPLVLSGARTGLHLTISNYKSRVMQNTRKRLQWTYVFWVYVTDYCSAAELCSLMHHITWDDRLASPMFHINRKGQIQVQVVLETGASVAFLTPSSFFIPKFEWVRLIIAAYPDKPWNLYLNYGPQFELKASTIIMLENKRPSYDDAFGVFVVGGSEIYYSFTGYVGEATLYRRKSLTLDQVPLPSPSHQLFKMPLDNHRKECLKYIGDVNFAISHSKMLLDQIIKRKSCPNNLPFGLISSVESFRQSFSASRSHHHELMYRLVKRRIVEGMEVDLEDLGSEIYQNATDILENDDDLDDLGDFKTLQSLLQQAACLGCGQASFLLSVILNYGLTIPVSETQAQFYLMSGAMVHHRLSHLSLANKHVFGLDGFPVSMEHAYVYYKEVADLTRGDLESPDNADGLTEIVRLTSETDINAQTEETGDLFMWLKHQASQGVTNAQRHMARMLYWGVQGIKKNVAAAAEYYKMSAASGDPIALYDYGIIQLKGHGTKKNVSGAVESLQAAAKFHHPDALNTLGWHALEIERNFTKAANYFQEAYSRGNKDAAFNLAHMYLQGHYPGSGVDREKGFELIAKAAALGQMDAGILFATYVIRDHPMIGRDANLAMQWVRYVAEQNPSVGKILSSGVKAFRKRLWRKSLIYYLMAASSGVEVANFNLAYLCDENYGNVASLLEKECKWHHFNLSTQRMFKDVSPYAWIKMAEYYYYGALDKNPDHETAVEMYGKAALAGDPQGIFSLASIMEEGINVSSSIWKKLSIREDIFEDHSKLLLHLYSRCSESSKEESFLPCTMALYRIKLIHLYHQYKLIGMALLVLLVTALIGSAANQLHRFPRAEANAGNRVQTTAG